MGRERDILPVLGRERLYQRIGKDESTRREGLAWEGGCVVNKRMVLSTL